MSTNQRRGGSMNAAGEETEAVVEATAERLWKLRFAMLFRQHAPTKMVRCEPRPGRAPRKLYARVGKARVDFTGFLCRDQRAVAFDVKSSSQPRFRLVARGESMLKANQLQELLDVDSIGGLAGVLVALSVPAATTWNPNGTARRWFWVDVSTWVQLVELARVEGKASIPLKTFEVMGVPVELRGHGRGQTLALEDAWREQ